jgi:hypothetical protein
MKKSLFIILAIVFMSVPMLSFGQTETETKVDENTEKKCNISYSFINEYGTSLGGAFGFTAVFVNGICFKKTQDCIGIGIGYEIDTRSEHSIPLFVNYRHYFGKKTFKPLINIGIGARLSIWDEWIGYGGPSGHWYDNGYSKTRVTPGIYAVAAGGFKVKAFSVTSGFFLKSWNNEYFGGFEVKVGFTF